MMNLFDLREGPLGMLPAFTESFFLFLLGLRLFPSIVFRMGMGGGHNTSLYGEQSAKAHEWASFAATALRKWFFFNSLVACGTHSMMFTLLPTGSCFESETGQLGQLISLIRAAVLLEAFELLLLSLMSGALARALGSFTLPRAFGYLCDNKWKFMNMFIWVAPWTGGQIICQMARADAFGAVDFIANGLNLLTGGRVNRGMYPGILKTVDGLASMAEDVAVAAFKGMIAYSLVQPHIASRDTAMVTFGMISFVAIAGRECLAEGDRLYKAMTNAASDKGDKKN